MEGRGESNKKSGRTLEPCLEVLAEEEVNLRLLPGNIPRHPLFAQKRVHIRPFPKSVLTVPIVLAGKCRVGKCAARVHMIFRDPGRSVIRSGSIEVIWTVISLSSEPFAV